MSQKNPLTQDMVALLLASYPQITFLMLSVGFSNGETSAGVQSSPRAPVSSDQVISCVGKMEMVKVGILNRISNDTSESHFEKCEAEEQAH